MISSGYVTLAFFLAALQMAAAAWAVVLGVRSLGLKRQAGEPGAERLEARTYLAGLLGYLLLGTSLASWLVFYLVLDSFVPQWPEAMCIYGITQIGAGSRGIFAWLPTLVLFEQATKPVLVFVLGAALVLYRFYRQLGTQTLLPRVAALLLIGALVASADAATEVAYLAIPKRESLPGSGCCSVAATSLDRGASSGARDERWLEAIYYGCQAAMAVMAWRTAGRRGDTLAARHILPLAAMAALTLAVSLRFFIDVASPKLLHLPYHRCLYDLLPGVPESGAALALLLGATFCVGWAMLVGTLGRCPEGLAACETESRDWLRYAFLGYLGSTAMISFDLWLA
ncbi:MAG TPA: hypothetical protein VHC22_00700 [Pirellulales bacterium]|nr:hypothetical protein [Pirellulales bacterium]